MILETQEEKDAFDFICRIASEETDTRGCNDLTKEDMEKFKGLVIESTEGDGKTVFQRIATMDFDIIGWLIKQSR